MPSILEGTLRLVIIPGDHDPPHTHVLGPGWEIRIRLTDPPSLWSIKGAPKRPEVARALSATAKHRTQLLAFWKDMHHE